MRSPFNLEYDVSNGSWYVFYLEVYNTSNDQCWTPQPFGFPTLGHAMHFCQPQIASPFVQDKPGGTWYAELKRNSDFDGTSVRIQQLVMVNG